MNISFLSRRFVAGANVQDAVRTVRRLNADGISATIDCLGEDVLTLSDADIMTACYEELLEQIRYHNLDANVSIKLSAFGLALDENVALKNLITILEHASLSRDPFVRIDMEGSPLVDSTLRVF